MKEKMLELRRQFYNGIRAEYSKANMRLRFPEFYGAMDLRLSIHYADGVFYVHDNGWSIRYLKKRVQNDQLADSMIEAVCDLGCIRTITSPRIVRNQCVVGAYTTGHGFFLYLQKLIFIMNADLIYDKMDEKVYRYDFEYAGEEQAEKFDWEKHFINLMQCFEFLYDEKAVYLRVFMFYSTFSTRACFQLDLLSDETMMISDRLKGNLEGEILEAYYWDHEDIEKYREDLEPYLQRYGGILRDKNVYKITSCKKWRRDFWQFFNLAVLLSKFGNKINLPHR